ncbi:multicopper oxidase family protein [Arthrobacter sp. ISL-5]|uniref:multicopper oxidase family protein n=1 Tax=Arthrobacter sp. ISL-5 TaxID=2819111 RepID=UPI001BEA0DED|nr:multicopper oxidase family protein [Arthrobacter sp. ISL-5]MBT2553021.1 multicopper oxidase family protein [Arthrobacter sp. ISL-5]
MRDVSRRTFLGAGLLAGIGLGVGIPFSLGAGGSTSTGNLLRSRLTLPLPFTMPFRAPPVLHPVRSDAAADFYDISQSRADASILPGMKTEIWGYNGIFPGPTIVTRRGRPAVVRHTNNLPVPTVVHLHGGRTPHDSDGYPIDFIYPVDMSYMNQHMDTHGHETGMGAMVPGDTTIGQRSYRYPLDQRAATLWYHDHRMDFTGPSLWRGLAGFHLVRDDEEDTLGLPAGARELPIMITDRSFEATGNFLYPSTDPSLMATPGVTGSFVAGVLGDAMLVNGTPWPVAKIDGAKYRLRILNACNARRLDLRIDPQPDGGLTQIGTDGGLLAAPIRHEHFELAPAQRVDAIIDFAGYKPGTAVTLLNDFGEGNMSQIMRFIVGPKSRDTFTVPDRLATIEPLTAADAVTTRTFRFQSGDVNHTKGWLIDAQPFSPDNISAAVKLGTVEIWRLIADFHHPVHLHLNPFQVLSRGIGGPGAFDAGWKDTIDLRPAEEAAIAIRFEGYAGKYVFHCHNLEHEDMAMMANFITR